MAMLTGLAFVSYMQRINISVAAEFMAPDLLLSKVQMGQVFSSFLIGYALMQIPGGLLADSLGTRITLAVSAGMWGICTALTGLVPTPAHVAFGASFAILWISRLLLGCAEATTYPVGALTVHNWIRPPGRAFANSLMFAGTSLASALSIPLVSWLMLRVGWRAAFYLTSLPAFAIAAAWWIFSTDAPGQHRSINRAELALTNNTERETATAPDLRGLLRNRKILLLCARYIAEGYLLFICVFWLFIYLVEVRHFSIMQGGFIAALPWLTGLCLTPLGGWAADRIAAERGRLSAAKFIIMLGYTLAGTLLFVAAYAPTSRLCVATLCLSVGSLMSAEASFWVSATFLVGESAGAVSGLMNTAGILGGIVSTSLVPVLVARFNRLVACGSATVVAMTCVVLWIFIARPSTSNAIEWRGVHP